VLIGCKDVPFYSSHTASGKLVNTLKSLLDGRRLSSFALSKRANLSPTTTRKIYSDPCYIPSPDVLEKLCVTLECSPGDILDIRGNIKESAVVVSGVF
jgi:DNA-binding Xre family transcriptional regulator